MSPNGDLFLRELSLQSFPQRPPKNSVEMLNHDFHDRDSIFLCLAAAQPEALTRSSQKTCRTAELLRQLFDKLVEPVLPDWLPVAALLGQENLHEMRGAQTHEMLRCQLSRRVSVVTVSTCSPNRFM